jgi:UDP-glucuronate 4-epimerase
MRVLITGGAGFVGLALGQALLENGDEVVLFDRRPPPPSFLASMRARRSHLVSLQGDVCNDDDVARAFDGVTHVFHGAAITAGPQREAAAPLQVLDVNLGGTVRVLRAAADHGVRRFVYPSSLMIYGAAIEGAASEPAAAAGSAGASVAAAVAPAALRETAPPAPHTLYGITKYAGETTALRLGSLWGVSVVAGRLGSVFGPWEGETGLRDMISPYAQVAACAARGETAILPAPFPRREMIYAADLAAGLVALLTAHRPAHPVYNLSANVDWDDTMASWCAALQRQIAGFRWQIGGTGAPNIDYHGAKPRVGLDATRARDDLGFQIRYPRDAAVEHYAAWVASHKDYFI